MKIFPTLIAITALPLLALGQTTDQQKDTEQGQTNEFQEKTPAKKKKAHEAAKVQPSAETKAQGQATGTKKTESGPASSKTQAKVNKQEFKSQHREVFTLGQHPKEFFIQRYGTNHFRLIGNTYFVFVDSC